MCETSIQMLMLDEIRLRLHVHHEPFCFFSGALLGLDADRTEMLDWMRSNHAEILSAIRDSGKFEEESEQKLITALDAFADVFQPTQAKGTEAA